MGQVEADLEASQSEEDWDTFKEDARDRSKATLRP